MWNSPIYRSQQSLLKQQDTAPLIYARGIVASQRRRILTLVETASVGIEHLTYRMSLTSSIILKICIQVDLWWSGIGLVQLGSNEIRALR